MKIGIYAERNLPLLREADCDLVEFDPQLLPAMLSAIAGRLGPSHWQTPEAWAEGFDRLSRQGAALMMGCKQDLITEIRGVRDGEPGHADYSLAVHGPGLFPATSLATLRNVLYAEPNTTAELLTQIRDQLVANGEGSAEQIELLGQLVMLAGL